MHLAVYGGGPTADAIVRPHAPATIADVPPEVLTEIFPNLNIKDMSTAVDATGTDIGDDDLESIHELSRLKSLNLSGCSRITDKGLAYVAKLKQLRVLNLTGCDQITNTGLLHVAQLTQLTSLDLSGDVDIDRPSKITDTGLEHIAQLTQLISLSLKDCADHGRGAPPHCQTQ